MRAIERAEIHRTLHGLKTDTIPELLLNVVGCAEASTSLKERGLDERG